jgi:hypothetical protein
VRADRAAVAFDLDAVDRPQRATRGKLLAMRLIRDARKYLYAARRREILSNRIEKPNRHSPPPTTTELDDIRHAVAVIRSGLSNLGSRDRLALMTKVAGFAAGTLLVKGRQQRNLVAAARERLWLQPGVALACEVVMEGQRPVAVRDDRAAGPAVRQHGFDELNSAHPRASPVLFSLFPTQNASKSKTCPRIH